jgi:type IV pilus assembly protein PilM
MLKIDDTHQYENYLGVQLRRIFKSSPKPLVGLDLSTASLNWVELAQDGQAGLVLERCVMEPLQPGWMLAGDVAQFDEVAAALRRLVKASGSHIRQVALAMPDSAVVVSKIELASDLGEAELRRQVATEVERLSGKPLADMRVDYSVQTPANRSRQGTEVDVWIAAAAQDKVQDRLGLAEAAGLEAVILDVEAEASMLAARRLTRARHTASADPLMALIQVDTQGCSLHVTHQGELVHAVRKPAQSSLGRHCEEASPEAYAHAFAQPFVQTLADSLASDIDGFLAASAHRKMDTVLLAGGSPWLPVLQKAIKQRTFSDCLLVDAFSGMRVSEAIQNAPFYPAARASMLTACGLALRRFHGAC